MKSCAIYYPYIEVPKSSWFTRILLYWDEVGAIVPSEYIEDPQQLGSYMRNLVTEGLVTQLVPGMYLWKLDNFADAFIDYIDYNYSGNECHNTLPWVKVHMEKLQNVGEFLIEKGLARKNPLDSWAWFDVEPKTATDFMAYLAAVMGQLAGRDRYYPITDNVKSLNPFLSHSKEKCEANIVRKIILEGILPSPISAIEPARLADFKAKYTKELSRFRREIESKVVELASIEIEEYREYRIEHLKGDLMETIEEISSRMSEEKKWPIITFGDFCAVAGAVSSGYKAILDNDLKYGLVAAGFGLAPAVYNALKGTNLNIEEKPLAYAAIARRQLTSSFNR